MKHNYNAWRYLDPLQPIQKGQSLNLSKESQGNTQQIASVKTALKKKLAIQKKKSKTISNNALPKPKALRKKLWTRPRKSKRNCNGKEFVERSTLSNKNFPAGSKRSR
jgi:hypothetical protein